MNKNKKIDFTTMPESDFTNLKHITKGDIEHIAPIFEDDGLYYAYIDAEKYGPYNRYGEYEWPPGTFIKQIIWKETMGLKLLEKKSLDTFGVEDRFIKAAEEVGEFLQAFSKFINDESLGSAKSLWIEICDVRMALDQLEHRLDVFGLSKQDKAYIKGLQLGKLHKAIDEANSSQNNI